MNGAFLHLAVNHIPVVGLPFAFLLLAGGVFRKSRDLVGAGFVALILVAIMTIVALKSGGPAAHIVRDLPGITRATIHNHAEAADDAGKGVVILGAMGILGLWFLKRSNEIPKNWTLAVMICALLASGWMAWVAHLGGLIRHPEIESGFQPPPSAPPETPHGEMRTKR